MKQILLCMLFWNIGLVALAQESGFYFYKGEKITVDALPGCFFVEEPIQKRFEKGVEIQKKRFSKVDVKRKVDMKRLPVELAGKKLHPVYIYGGDTISTVNNEFIVRLKNANDSVALFEKMKRENVSLVFKYPYDTQTYILKNELANRMLLETVSDYYDSGLFEYAEPNFMMSGNQETFSSVMPAPQTNYLNQHTWWNTVIKMDILRSDSSFKNITGNGINVAVIDNGINARHKVFDSIPSIINGVCLTEGSDKGIIEPNDQYNTHGTFCAGIIGGTPVAYNDYPQGVAPKVVLMPVKVRHENDRGELSSETSFALGIESAWKGIRQETEVYKADVLNCSWKQPPSELIARAIRNAVTQGRDGKGCVVVVSTGNDKAPFLHFPASLEEVIAVGAIGYPTNNVYRRWNESNYGQGLDIVAPGAFIWSATYTDRIGGKDRHQYASKSGTSWAAPQVAGVAALILSVDNTLTGDEVRKIIESNTQKINGYTFVNNASQPHGTWNTEVGYGLLDAYKAVSSVAEKPGISITGDNSVDYSPSRVMTFRRSGTIPSGATAKWVVNPNTLAVVSSGSTELKVKFGAGGNASLTDTVWYQVKRTDGVIHWYKKVFNIEPQAIYGENDIDIDITSDMEWKGYLEMPFGGFAYIHPGKKLTIKGVVLCPMGSGFKVHNRGELILDPTCRIVTEIDRGSYEYEYVNRWSGIEILVGWNQTIARLFPSSIGRIIKRGGAQLPADMYCTIQAKNIPSVYYTEGDTPIDEHQVFWNNRITKEVTWTTPKLVLEPGIVIEPGGKLNLENTTLYMGVNSKIEIKGAPVYNHAESKNNASYDKHGGHFHMKGGKLRRSILASSDKWKGIIMNVTDKKVMNTFTSESYVSGNTTVRNSISDAETAFYVRGNNRNDQLNKLRIKDMTFSGCTHVLDMGYYISRGEEYFDTDGYLQDDYECYMSNCDVYGATTDPEKKMVKLTNVNGFKFDNCRFIVREETDVKMIDLYTCKNILFKGNYFGCDLTGYSHKRGVGIYSTYSDLRFSAENNTFENLKIGVQIYGTAPAGSPPLDIKFAFFTNNLCGAQIQYAVGEDSSVIVQSCQIDCLEADTRGIVLSNVMNYNVHSNAFNWTYSDQYQSLKRYIRGLYVVSNSHYGGNRRIDNNSFNDFETAMELNGYNKPVLITRNKFWGNSIAYDVSPLNYNYSNANMGIGNQGSPDKHTGNLFRINSGSNRLENSCGSYSYYYNTDSTQTGFRGTTSGTNMSWINITGTMRTSSMSQNVSTDPALFTTDKVLRSLDTDVTGNNSLRLAAADRLIAEEKYADTSAQISKLETLKTAGDKYEERHIDMLKLKLKLAEQQADSLTDDQILTLENWASENRFDAAGAWAKEMINKHYGIVEIIPLCPRPEYDDKTYFTGDTDILNTGMKASPNPDRMITLYLSDDIKKMEGEKNLTIVDVSGNTVIHRAVRDGEEVITTGDSLPVGVYSCVLTGAGGIISRTTAIIKK